MRPFSVRIPQYEGPLELLLSIVRTNGLAISDLPLAPLAAQFLAYIQEAERLDVNLSIEWIDMATRLIHWKSASLLPCDPSLPDPSASLARELARELKTLSEAQLQEAAGLLAARDSERGKVWTYPAGGEFCSPVGDDETTPSLWTLRGKARTLRDAFRERRESRLNAYQIEGGATSVEEMKAVALAGLQPVKPGVWFSAAAWFARAPLLEHRICLFLAILDLAESGIVRVEEDTVKWSVRLCRS